MNIQPKNLMFVVTMCLSSVMIALPLSANIYNTFTCEGSSVTSGKINNISEGKIEFWGVSFKQLSLSQDGENYDVALLSDDEYLLIDTISNGIGSLTNYIIASGVGIGTYTHLKLEINGFEIKGWGGDGVNIWHTVTGDTSENSDGKIIYGKRRSGAGAPSQSDGYGQAVVKYENTLYEQITKLAQPLIVTATDTVPLVIAEKDVDIFNILEKMDIEIEGSSDCSGIDNLTHISEGEKVYTIYANSEPKHYVRISFLDSGGSEFWLSLVYDSEYEVIGTSGHRLGTDWLVNATNQVEVYADGNDYDGESGVFNVRLSTGDEDDGDAGYVFTGNFTCGADKAVVTNGAGDLKIDAIDGAEINSDDVIYETGHSYCEKF